MGYDGWYSYLNAKDDWAKTDEDSPVVIDVLANDVGALGIIKVNGKPVTVDTAPIVLASGATVDLEGGTLRYDPGSAFQTLNAGQSASDTFSYTVSGSGRSTDTESVKVTVAGKDEAQPDPNRPPVAADDEAVLPEGVINPDDPAYSGFLEFEGSEEVNTPTYTTSVEIDVLANDTDPEGAPLKVASIAGTKVDTDPATDLPDTVALDDLGMTTVKLNADGSLTYTEVSFYFTLEDESLELMSTTDGDLVAIDPTTTPEEYFDLELWPTGTFTYTAIDDKGAESNAAAVTLYREVSVLNTVGVGEISMELPESDLDPTDLWLS